MNPGIRLNDGSFYPHSYTPNDLRNLAVFIHSHSRIVLMRDFSSGDRDPTAITIRHDVDHSAKHALRLAKWENRNNIQASYYLLPSASYYQDEAKPTATQLQALGHEVGIHNNAYTTTKGDADRALRLLGFQANQMRSWGIQVTGCADHGGEEPNNTLLWKEHEPSEATLEYEAYLLHKQNTHYISDNRGRALNLERRPGRPTHLLVHPCHWQIP